MDKKNTIVMDKKNKGPQDRKNTNVRDYKDLLTSFFLIIIRERRLEEER